MDLKPANSFNPQTTTMASNSLKPQIHTVIINPTHPSHSPLLQPPSLFSPNIHLSIFPSKTLYPSKIQSFTLQSSLSSSASSPIPPKSRQEAILQAKTSLTSTLRKPLNDPKVIASKFKKQNQPRFRVEIPVIDESPDSIAQLAFDVFRDLHVKRKGSPVKMLLIWGNPILRERGVKIFEGFEHCDLDSVMTVDNRILNSVDLGVVLAPDVSGLDAMEMVVERLDPKPVVLFNPSWGFDVESEFGEKMRGFVGSFEVVYAFLGLEVRGILSKRKGVVFKCVRDGVLSGENWSVFVEEEGELKVVSMFKSRPSIAKVESVLYSLMAVNSPLTKSAKFFRDLVSNVTGKK